LHGAPELLTGFVPSDLAIHSAMKILASCCQTQMSLSCSLLSPIYRHGGNCCADIC
jgi:hypothetical protein